MMLAENLVVPTKFWLATEPPRAADLSGEQGEPLAMGISKLRILIVEDEFFIALDTEAALTELGHSSVGIAVSCEQAVDIAGRERPDVVLMDIRLAGGRDGIDAAEEILTRFGIRSVFVTADTDPLTRRRAAAVDPVGILEKPLSLERLCATLDILARLP